MLHFSVFAREGLTAPRLPLDGSGMAMLDYGMVYEQLPPVVAIALLSHEVSTTRIFAESTDEQRERLLRIDRRTRICCTGSTEPDTDLTRAHQTCGGKGGKLVVNDARCGSPTAASVIWR